MSDNKDPQRISDSADNCEVLRARLAKYEDADGNPKAQPSGVVLPEREWLQECGLVYSLEDGVNHYEINVTQAGGSRATVDRENLASKIFQILSGDCLNSSPVSAGEYGDAYQGAREDMAIWKRRALEAETKVREQDQIIENLGNALNDENGPTFMGEPVLKARAALSAPSHGEQVRQMVPGDDELYDLASSACQMALAHGVGEESFMALARTVRDRCAMLAAAQSAGSQGGDV